MLKKLMNITCLQATLLTSKKEAGQNSFMENVKLALHHSICTGCKRFALQSKFITDNAKNSADFNEEKLSPQKKIIIKDLMK
jgi:hypothetical protein